MAQNQEVLPLDELISEAMGIEPEADEVDALIAEPFDPNKLKVSTETKTVDLLVRRIDEGEILLSPEFQRRARLWHPNKKSRLIESLLLRIPLPVFYVAADVRDNWVVVDGLQRITTIFDFVKSDFPLEGLEYLKSFHGCHFSDLARSMRRRIEETELVINVIQPGTPESVMINIFKRINTGGVPLNGQEIRNALFGGPVREFLRNLASSEAFLEATDKSVRDDRMDAQEMILRYMAFRLTRWDRYSTNNLDTFLNDAVQHINRLDSTERDALSAEFELTMKLAREVFGKDAFRKRYSFGDSRRPVSKALFETWGVTLASLDPYYRERVLLLRETLIQNFIALMNSNHAFVNSISYATGGRKQVEMRFNTIEQLLNTTVGLD